MQAAASHVVHGFIDFKERVTRKKHIKPHGRTMAVAVLLLRQLNTNLVHYLFPLAPQWEDQRKPARRASLRKAAEIVVLEYLRARLFQGRLIRRIIEVPLGVFFDILRTIFFCSRWQQRTTTPCAHVRSAYM